MANVPFPGLWNAAAAQAQAQLQAQLGAVAKSSHRETRRGQKFIRRLAHSFADELGGISAGVGQGYNQASAQQSAMDQALSSYLSGGGQDMASGLGAQLSYSPEAAALQSGQAAAVGRTGAKTGAGFGASQAQNFIASKADTLGWAKALPGVAALSGIQDAAAFQAQQAADLKSQRDSILGQAPGLTADLYGAFASQRLQQQQMAQAERFHAAEMHQQAADRNAAGEDQGRLGAMQDQAFGLASQLAQSMTNPATGEGPNYGDLHDKVAQFFRQRFPGRSDSWIAQQTDLVVGQLTALPPPFSDVQGFFGNLTHQGNRMGGPNEGTNASPAMRMATPSSANPAVQIPNLGIYQSRVGGYG